MHQSQVAYKESPILHSAANLSEPGHLYLRINMVFPMLMMCVLERRIVCIPLLAFQDTASFGIAKDCHVFFTTVII